MVGTGASRGREARSPGMTSARRFFAVHQRSARSGVPAEEILGAAEAARRSRAPEGGDVDRRTRRGLLIGGAPAGGAVAAGHPATALARRAARASARPRIAIVGAGLAGLRCAHMLWTQSPD